MVYTEHATTLPLFARPSVVSCTIYEFPHEDGMATLNVPVLCLDTDIAFPSKVLYVPIDGEVVRFIVPTAKTENGSPYFGIRLFQPSVMFLRNLMPFCEKSKP